MSDKGPWPPPCYAAHCDAPAEVEADAWVMYPPTRGFMSEVVYLCPRHGDAFVLGDQLAIVVDGQMAVARYRE